MTLFTLRKRQEPEQVAQIEIQGLEKIIPFPSAQVPLRTIESKKQRSYEEVAQSLGFVPAELIRAQLLEFFEEEGIKIYNNFQVIEWLTKKKVEAKVELWCWRPLREKDIITDYIWGYNNENGTWSDGFYASSAKKWECRPYARIVPQHALEKVAKIEAKFGNRVKFFVSDYAAPDVDPFIMVRPTMCNDNDGKSHQFIFDTWDEPGFGV